MPQNSRSTAVNAQTVEKNPAPSGLSNSAQIPKTNTVTKRRWIFVSGDDRDEYVGAKDSPQKTVNKIVENQRQQDVTKSQDFLTKGKALKKQEVPPEENSSEDETSNR